MKTALVFAMLASAVLVAAAPNAVADRPSPPSCTSTLDLPPSTIQCETDQAGLVCHPILGDGPNAGVECFVTKQSCLPVVWGLHLGFLTLGGNHTCHVKAEVDAGEL